MSGYLQRLAARAMHPAEAIHPVLGSVYSPQYTANQPGFPQEEEPVVASTWAPSAAAPEPEGTLEVHETTVNRRDSHVPLTPAQTKPSVVPPITQGTPPSSTVTDEINSYEPLLMQEKQVVPAGVESAKRGELFQETRGRQTAFHGVYTPLLSPGVFRSSQQKIDGIQGPNYVSPARVPDMRGLSKSESHSEPDEIQIQIGRIEVTAVPQAQTRPAVKTARKGMSLDEYLKDRNRRA